MKIDIIKVGILDTNCYILSQNNECIIIDPGDDAKRIISHIKDNVVGIIVTHYHFDHIGALLEIKEKYNSVIYDKSNLYEGKNNISSFAFDVIYTPGHKEDLISILIDNKLFCGDFIFNSSIGRWDLPGGNINDMKLSIKKILDIKSNIVIYPGHGDITSLDDERDNLISFI